MLKEGHYSLSSIGLTDHPLVAPFVSSMLWLRMTNFRVSFSGKRVNTLPVASAKIPKIHSDSTGLGCVPAL